MLLLLLLLLLLLKGCWLICNSRLLLLRLS
jgi:hypothetical protein